MSNAHRPAEFELIDRIRARAGTRADVVLGIGDDAAVLQVLEGRELVVAMDTLNVGVHFPAGTPPADIGWKALAVNLSDLAAMGAEPAWCTLSLSLPAADGEWLDAFLDGFCALAQTHGVALVGGDTTRGPLSICIAAHGFVQAGHALRRSGACAGDDIWVTGTLGDAAAALAMRGIGTHAALFEAVCNDANTPAAAMAFIDARLARPTPRVEAGRALVGIATACIDLSDGLAADLAHVARASKVGIRIDADALPVSEALARLVDPVARRTLQIAGGDDYELAFTAPPTARENVCEVAAECSVAITRVGIVSAGVGVVIVDAQGRTIDVTRSGFEHFHATRR